MRSLNLQPSQLLVELCEVLALLIYKEGGQIIVFCPSIYITIPLEFLYCMDISHVVGISSKLWPVESLYLLESNISSTELFIIVKFYCPQAADKLPGQIHQSNKTDRYCHMSSSVCSLDSRESKLSSNTGKIGDYDVSE